MTRNVCLFTVCIAYIYICYVKTKNERSANKFVIRIPEILNKNTFKKNDNLATISIFEEYSIILTTYTIPIRHALHIICFQIL